MDHPTADFYRSIYRLLEHETPLRFDCGRLCDAACCQDSPDLPGMYLFPGEEALFGGLEGFSVSDADLPGYGPVRLLCCEGMCERAQRPLSCRIFPLAPAVSLETMQTRPDPRGKPICPLCRQEASALSGGFTAAVGRAFAALWAEPQCRRFLLALSRHLDEFGQPL